jgi:hypothetical protein
MQVWLVKEAEAQEATSLGKSCTVATTARNAEDL